mgnify:CR=1 FL=1
MSCLLFAQASSVQDSSVFQNEVPLNQNGSGFTETSNRLPLLLKDVKVYFKTKKELDKYSTKEGILHQGFVAEIEHLEKNTLKDYLIKNSKKGKDNSIKL